MPAKPILAVATALCALAPFGAAASAQSLDDFAECASVRDNGDRLKCYDKLGAMLAMTADERRAAAIAKAEENYGLPRERRKDREERLEIDHEVTAKVVSVGASGDKPTVTLDNGQVWKVTSSGHMQQFLRPGISVTIGEGTISGYRLRSDDISGMETVRRIQ